MYVIKCNYCEFYVCSTWIIFSDLYYILCEQWSQSMQKSEGQYPRQSSAERKEALYQDIIDYFDKGKVSIYISVEVSRTCSYNYIQPCIFYPCNNHGLTVIFTGECHLHFHCLINFIATGSFDWPTRTLVFEFNYVSEDKCLAQTSVHGQNRLS